MKRIIVLLTTLLLLLTGCAPKEDGFFHQSLVQPFSDLIKYFGSFFDGSYGMGIVLVTVCVRLLLLPMMLNATKRQKEMQGNMKLAQPEIKKLQDQINAAKDDEEKAALTRELLKVYGKYNVSPMNMGCLPIIIQTPILMALYFAITHSKEIAAQSFLWFNLGSPDIIMMLIAGTLYFLQSWISFQYMPESTRKQMKPMLFISPIMIIFISFHSPAALPLYWSVGAIFMIFQQYLSHKLYKNIE
ncbi:membrane protein insertase YidC [Macrococcus armenti]|uniref:membrane protein insertase YidC n=1 Tax=Macrococcus armenti TaxID=2875764 RepID=UPI001CD01231|nr:membrane protein insertase YidC [Macrococcus armenti]UBH15056.1 membrane protein insertase YidC [Macrococcus armenti]UBH17417.1 membrane protein insertase YidC [Macrococcus armenti]UBH19681.1 membrane protein insertase YidC [Macrococcus armenti]UBH22046.1 membrane protein insertase YidC [Macrococcus armenti]